jgi:SWI/SNF-related matrix-associated actin-dependent regulator of chromatin subfamily A3
LKQVRVLLSEKEHLMYRAYDTQAIELFAELQKQGIEFVKAKYHFLIVVILRLRQLCDHVALCKDIEQFFVDARQAISTGDVGRLTHRVATAEGCCVCEETTERMFMLPCAHVLCDQHVSEASEAGQCSMCGEQAEAGEIQTVSVAAKKVARLTLAEEQEPSTKMRKILEIVNEMRAKGGPKAKLVLFSQFRQFLDICEDFLRANGVTTTRIDGTMSRTARVASMQAFNAGRPEVMLASLMAAGVGINLLGGCNVIIADPWWNPAVENQAMDRVHRIGQTQPVTVHRLVVAGSIEERLLDVQDAKSQLANAALVLRSPEELRDLNVKMISKLFSGGTATHVRGKRGRLDANAKILPIGARPP